MVVHTFIKCAVTLHNWLPTYTLLCAFTFIHYQLLLCFHISFLVFSCFSNYNCTFVYFQSCTIRISNEQTASYALDMALAQCGLVGADACREHMLVAHTSRGDVVPFIGHENLCAVRAADPDCRFIVRTRDAQVAAPSTRRARLFGQLRSKSKSASSRSLDSAAGGGGGGAPRPALFAVPLPTLMDDCNRLPKPIMVSECV